jgi:serine/threonine-protein kinase RsbW
MEEEFKLELPSEPRFVRVARLAIGNLATQAAFPEEDVDDIKVCISEACNSIIKDQSKEPGDRIGIHCMVTDDGLKLKVSAMNSALDESTWDKYHTMGKTFVETLMDDVKYQRNWNGSSFIEMMKFFPEKGKDLLQ